MAPPASSAACGRAGAGVIRASLQARKSRRSPAGTPSRSQMTMMGSCPAYAASRSARPSASTASSSSPATRRTGSRSFSTRPGGNALTTRRRTRVGAGGSMLGRVARGAGGRGKAAVVARRGGALVHREARVGERPPHIVVAGDQPGGPPVGAGDPVDRARLPERGQGRIQIFDQRGGVGGVGGVLHGSR